MPVAMPICRKVELMPDAMPDLSGVTTPTAVEASGTLMKPMPMPATTRPGMIAVHDVSGPMRVSSDRPMPVTMKPGAMSHFVGTVFVSRPAAAEAKKASPDRNSSRQPAPRAE